MSRAPKNLPLFRGPDPVTRPLSDMYSGKIYRATTVDRPRYSNIKAQHLPTCDECFANQHERGAFAPPRAMGKVRRTIPNGPPLALCRLHTAAWQERDETDTG